jgi:hypothetical protein
MRENERLRCGAQNSILMSRRWSGGLGSSATVVEIHRPLQRRQVKYTGALQATSYG